MGVTAPGRWSPCSGWTAPGASFAAAGRRDGRHRARQPGRPSASCRPRGPRYTAAGQAAASPSRTARPGSSSTPRARGSAGSGTPRAAGPGCGPVRTRSRSISGPRAAPWTSRAGCGSGRAAPGRPGSGSTRTSRRPTGPSSAWPTTTASGSGATPGPAGACGWTSRAATWASAPRARARSSTCRYPAGSRSWGPAGLASLVLAAASGPRAQSACSPREPAPG